MKKHTTKKKATKSTTKKPASAAPADERPNGAAAVLSGAVDVLSRGETKLRDFYTWFGDAAADGSQTEENLVNGLAMLRSIECDYREVLTFAREMLAAMAVDRERAAAAAEVST